MGMFPLQFPVYDPITGMFVSYSLDMNGTVTNNGTGVTTNATGTLSALYSSNGMNYGMYNTPTSATDNSTPRGTSPVMMPGFMNLAQMFPQMANQMNYTAYSSGGLPPLVAPLVSLCTFEALTSAHY
jgi:hypothetical protein